MLETLQPFGIAAVIGLIIGIERERSHTRGRVTMGVRTFTLLSLLGAAAAWTPDKLLGAVLALFMVAIIIAGYLRGTRGTTRDAGITTEMAGALVFVLGYMARTEPGLAMALGVILLTTLYTRRNLRVFARSVIKPEELRAAVVLLVFFVVVIPFMPMTAVDPWGLFVPRKLASLMALLAGIQFAGHVAERVAGARVGLALTGFFGGLASSTAVIINMPKMVQRRPETTLAAAGAAAMATSASLTLAGVVIWGAAADLSIPVAVPAFCMALTCAGLGLLIAQKNPTAGHFEQGRSPLDIIAVTRMTILIALLLGLVSLVKQFAGVSAVNLVAFIGGLFELHSVALATATLQAQKEIDARTASTALQIAILASLVSKLFITWVSIRNKYALLFSAVILATTLVGVGVSLLIHFFVP
jgi:uncharacterized membrane protein (DUF4010 family)